MRYSSFAVLALASAVFALPTPQDIGSTNTTQSTDEMTIFDSANAGADSGSASRSDNNTAGSVEAQGSGISPSTTSSGAVSIPTPSTDPFTLGDSNAPSEDAGQQPQEFPTFDTNAATQGATPPLTFPTPDSNTTSTDSNITSPNPGTFSPGNGVPSNGQEPSVVGLLPCGDAFYEADKYTCYDTFLCPIIEGVATKKCAEDCYLESLYTCENEELQTIEGAAGTAPSADAGQEDGTAEQPELDNQQQDGQDISQQEPTSTDDSSNGVFPPPAAGGETASSSPTTTSSSLADVPSTPTASATGLDDLFAPQETGTGGVDTSLTSGTESTNPADLTGGSDPGAVGSSGSGSGSGQLKRRKGGM